MTNVQAPMTNQPTEMPNDQAPMTNQTTNSNDQRLGRDWALLFAVCCLIGHWCLGIGH
jgi:hypothetical protein